MSSKRSGFDVNRLAGRVISGGGVFDRPAGLHINASGPSDRNEGFGRDQLAGSAIEYIKEAIFRRLQKDFANMTLYSQIGENDVLSAVVIPYITWHYLVMPHVRAG